MEGSGPGSTQHSLKWTLPPEFKWTAGLASTSPSWEFPFGDPCRISFEVPVSSSWCGARLWLVLHLHILIGGFHHVRSVFSVSFLKQASKFTARCPSGGVWPHEVLVRVHPGRWLGEHGRVLWRELRHPGGSHVQLPRHHQGGPLVHRSGQTHFPLLLFN